MLFRFSREAANRRLLVSILGTLGACASVFPWILKPELSVLSCAVLTVMTIVLGISGVEFWFWIQARRGIAALTLEPSGVRVSGWISPRRIAWSELASLTGGGHAAPKAREALIMEALGLEAGRGRIATIQDVENSGEIAGAIDAALANWLANAGLAEPDR